MNNRFGMFHPATIFVYFVVIIALSMIIMHPVFLLISLFFSFMFSYIVNGAKSIRFNLAYVFPMAIMSILINVLFNHNGQTIMFYLPGGVSVSCESIVAGFVTAGMIVVVICWFSCYNAIMTNEKFVYLFGKWVPSLSLVLSMILRFVPRFKSQFKKTVYAQRCIGCDITTGKLAKRLKNLVKITSVMTVWALENSMETAISMKARGYGLKGKTSMSMYKFGKTDFAVLVFTLASFGYVLFNVLNGRITYQYYPVVNINMNLTDVFVIFFVLCAVPVIIEIQEIIKWKYYQSKI